MQSGERTTGMVKWFNNAKGYGFIESAEGDVFVHYSAIRKDGYKTLRAGSHVEYEVQHSSKGLFAQEVSSSE
ncbi:MULTISPECIES: cold shock domain-containing protein [unclassified Hahella]|uniref:cold shock domain-containing protein n=1 Tax=unclassified Hahella TaxID=2624107 RepID=UPI000FDD46BE|nr:MULTISPECIES: cold shock domain-containing protein [unclassified Hahella]AZZ94919.1 cold shock domain protein CspD [Hahella sp. KA22]MBU6954655.1 cold shock domain-containing protein [Hahella sp. HN01]MDG9666975.1 cold shock domain-containing protein [Hahella sp. CR1]QAY52563.1 cold shock domain protein CspD [Hahella sp. KA22]WLQ13592.1 cold shock domain-containing protein [Hahella sp. HNIBRBA332]